MKTNYWLIFGAMISTSLLAQQVTNAPPAAPLETPVAAPAATNAPSPAKTNAPVAKAGKKKAAPKKKAKSAPKKAEAVAELKTVPLVAGPAVVVASNVNVRGQAKLKSEVVGRLTKGQSVTVIEEIVRNNSGPEEPSAWAKIACPPTVHTWVNSTYIDATNKTVMPKRLKVRAGPGENYSVLGILERGEAVREVTVKGDWMEIEAPTNAYAFMAAQYLKQEAPGAVAVAAAATTTTTATPPEPAPAAAVVAEATAMAPAPTEAPAVTNAAPEAPGMTNVVAETTTTNATEAAMIDEPPPKRVVQHEGIVRGMTSIQAPSRFALVSPENGRLIDYLHTTSRELDLRRYKGLKIIVTGEEGLDERWGNTPVITIQKIVVSDETVPGVR